MRSEGWRDGGRKCAKGKRPKRCRKSPGTGRAEPLPNSCQQRWAEALASPYDGASLVSSLQKECDQQIPQGFLLSCCGTHCFSTPQANPQGTYNCPKIHLSELKSSLVKVWASSGSPWLLRRFSGLVWSCDHSPIGD